MPSIKIQLPNPLDEIRHPKLIALRKEKIGPLWPVNDPDWKPGMRGVPLPSTRKTDTKRWDRHREHRRVRAKIAAKSRRRNAGS